MVKTLQFTTATSIEQISKEAVAKLEYTLYKAQCSSTGVPWNRIVPQNIYWGSMSFKGSLRIPCFLGEMISCFSVLMHHYEIF